MKADKKNVYINWNYYLNICHITRYVELKFIIYHFHLLFCVIARMLSRSTSWSFYNVSSHYEFVYCYRCFHFFFFNKCKNSFVLAHMHRLISTATKCFQFGRLSHSLSPSFFFAQSVLAHATDWYRWNSDEIPRIFFFV